jgi:hypothetical protein
MAMAMKYATIIKGNIEISLGMRLISMLLFVVCYRQHMYDHHYFKMLQIGSISYRLDPSKSNGWGNNQFFRARQGDRDMDQRTQETTFCPA